MLKVYGTPQCPDCAACKAAFEARGIGFEMHDFSEDLHALKEFLAIRDSNPLFEDVKKEGRIGIPCVVRDDGTVSLDWEEFTVM